MECFLDCYLEKMKILPRYSLHDRRKRREMVEYINTLIQGCSGVENGDIETTSKIAINKLIQYHQEIKCGNGTVCMMGKYHNILYVAVKLCYLWQIKDADLVAQLLKEIYACEGTFERIIIGAIFGTKAPHYIAGWKSDFDDQEDNFRGLIYFLDKATLAKSEFPFEISEKIFNFRFVDLPIESCGKASTVKLCVQLGLPDKLWILLRFGAMPSNDMEDDESNNIEYVLNRLTEFNHCYPYNLVACLQILLRVVPSIKFKEQNDIRTLTRLEKYEKYKELVEDGILPLSRCGYTPPELKHLCRCSIRKRLWENFQLPMGISQLPVPETLSRYVDIMLD